MSIHVAWFTALHVVALVCLAALAYASRRIDRLKKAYNESVRNLQCDREKILDDRSNAWRERLEIAAELRLEKDRKLNLENQAFTDFVRELEAEATKNKSGFRYLGISSVVSFAVGSRVTMTGRGYLPMEVVALAMDPEQLNYFDLCDVRLGNNAFFSSASPLPAGSISGMMLEQPAMLWPGVDAVVEATLRPDAVAGKIFRAVLIGKVAEDAVFRDGRWVSVTPSNRAD